MVKPCELAKVKERGSVIGSRRVPGIIKETQVNAPLVSRDLGNPSVAMGVDAFIFGFFASIFSRVRMILRNRTWAQVASAIIQSVLIFMVHLWHQAIRDGTVHKNVVAFPFTIPAIQGFIVTDSVKSSGGRIPGGRPIPLHQELVIRSINYDHLTFGEWNKFDRLIERLNNRLAVHATFGHGSTSNGIAAFSRLCIIQGVFQC